MLIIVTGAIERDFRFIFAQKQQPTQLAIYNLMAYKNAYYTKTPQYSCLFGKKNVPLQPSYDGH